MLKGETQMEFDEKIQNDLRAISVYLADSSARPFYVWLSKHMVPAEDAAIMIKEDVSCGAEPPWKDEDSLVNASIKVAEAGLYPSATDEVWNNTSSEYVATYRAAKRDVAAVRAWAMT